MHLLRQHLLRLLRHGLLRHLGHGAVARGVALGARGAGVVDGVGDYLLDFLGQLLLEFLRHDAVAYGVRLVGSLGHGWLGWGLFGGVRGDGIFWGVVVWFVLRW